MLDHVPTKTEKARLICRRFFAQMWKADGFMTNFVLVLMNFLLTVCIPIPILFFHVWVLIEATIFPDEVEQKTLSIYDVIWPSSYTFWLDLIPSARSLIFLAALGALFMFVALLEMITYYATCLKDTGKYPKVRSAPKTFILWTFWFLLSIYVALYTALATVFLVWCLLGALLNPAAFLPIAAGSATFIIFVKT